MVGEPDSPEMPPVSPMPKPPDARIIPLDRQNPLTHQQVEQVRFGLGDTGPLAQAVLNANVPAVMKQLTVGSISCLSSRRPNDPVQGQMVFETDTKQVMFWDGSAWVTAANSSPTGSLMQFAGSSAPTGWLLCDGSSKATADYPALFGVIQYTYGGAGASFTLPDLRGRSAVGAGTGTGLTTRTLAATGGEETHLLTGAESGIQQHLHTAGTLYLNNSTGSTGKGVLVSNTANVSTAAANIRVALPSDSTIANKIEDTGYQVSGSTANRAAADATSAHQNMHPFLVLNYIIKT